MHIKNNSHESLQTNCVCVQVILYMLFISVDMHVNQILYTSAFIDNVRHVVDQHSFWIQWTLRGDNLETHAVYMYF